MHDYEQWFHQSAREKLLEWLVLGPASVQAQAQKVLQAQVQKV
jgi:hypothetical protein